MVLWYLNLFLVNCEYHFAVKIKMVPSHLVSLVGILIALKVFVTCLPVEHNILFYLIFFIKLRMFTVKLRMFTVKLIICIPVKAIYLHDTYCLFRPPLLCSPYLVLVETSQMATWLGKC